MVRFVGSVEGMSGEKAFTFSLPEKMLARYQLSVASLAPLTRSAQYNKTYVAKLGRGGNDENVELGLHAAA